MIIGPLTIRRTKDIQEEQVTRDKAKAVSSKLIEMLLHDNRRYKAALQRWGVSEGVIKGKAEVVK